MNKFTFCCLAFFVLFSTQKVLGANEFLDDRFIIDSLAKKEIKKPQTITKYDYSDTDSVKIPLKITEKITTKGNKAYESQKLTFVVDKNVYYKNKLLVKKGAKADAKVEIITKRGLGGIPAEIFISDFKIENLDNRKIKEPVSKRGFSTASIILPIKWALTPFPPFGSLTNIIVGCNASLTPRKTLYIHYFPNYKFD